MRQDGDSGGIAPATQGSSSTTGGSGSRFTVGATLLAILAAMAMGRRR